MTLGYHGREGSRGGHGRKDGKRDTGISGEEKHEKERNNGRGRGKHEYTKYIEVKRKIAIITLMCGDDGATWRLGYLDTCRHQLPFTALSSSCRVLEIWN